MTPIGPARPIEAVPIVDADAVTRRFGQGAGSVLAVHDVTCRLLPGDRVALMGSSGSGKTTLLHLLAGLDLPTLGTVTWPAIGALRDLRPGRVAVVFQAPSLLPPLDVLENTALPMLLRGVAPSAARARAFEALQVLGLESLATRLPEDLSGGQAQRVAVARVLADHPALILADEPTGQLDRRTGAAVVDALLTAAVLTRAALVISTHDRLIADRLPVRWSMAAGRMTADTANEPLRC